MKAHETQDVAVVHIGSTSLKEGRIITDIVKCVVTKHLAPSGVLMPKMGFMKKFDQVLTSNDVYVFGYPNSIGLKEYPQIDHQKPLIRKGIVAGTNDQKKAIIIDCFLFHGNSGGPVL